MRKLFVLAFFLVAFSVWGQAQQATSFRPYWSLEGQAGASYTLGEGSFTSMLSPAFSVNVGYHFCAPVEIRLGVGGLSGKSYSASLAKYYQYDFVRGQADLIIHSYGHFYTLVGAGVILGTSNGAEQFEADKDSFRYLWKAPKAFATGRFGIGYRFPVGRNIAITTEAVYHLLPDALNSIRNVAPGGNVQVLAGFHFSFGHKAKKADVTKAVIPVVPPIQEDYTPEVPVAVDERVEAEEEAAEPELLEAEPERPAVEPERPATQPTEEEKRAAEVAAEQFAEALAKAVAEAAGLSDVRIYFESDSWTVQAKYEPELQKLASFLLENPSYLVKLTAYCDSRYGSAEYNLLLSERRANAVSGYLKKQGVDASQILTSPAGGTDTFSNGGNIKRNRFVVCQIVK
jgi:outer membrane protein OmpA-like peptidoglycan-associated protein